MGLPGYLALMPKGVAGLPIRRELQLGRLFTAECRRRLRLRCDVAVAVIAMGIISVAIISTAIRTPLISAVDASNATGCQRSSDNGSCLVYG